MADVKISGLTAASSANRNMQLEVNDSGTDRRVTAAQLANLAWSQVGSTQNVSGFNTFSFSSIGSYDELQIVSSDIVVTDQSGNGVAQYIASLEISTDNGSTWIFTPSTDALSIGAPFIFGDGDTTLLGGVHIFSKKVFQDSNYTKWDIYGCNDTTGSVGLPSGSSRLGGFSQGSVIIYLTAPITNLRVKSFWVDNSGDQLITLNTMISGSVSLYKR